MGKINLVINTSSIDRVHKPSQVSEKKKVTFHEKIQADAIIPKPGSSTSNRKVTRITINESVKSPVEILKALVVDKPIKKYEFTEGNQNYHYTNVSEKLDGPVMTNFGRNELTYFFQSGKRMNEVLLKDNKTGEVRQGYKEDGILYVQPKGSNTPIGPDDEIKTPRNVVIKLKNNPLFYQTRTTGAIASNGPLSFRITNKGIVPK